MPDKINAGSFRDPISVYYKTGSTTTDMGSEQPVFENYDLFADVNQLSGKSKMYYGLNIKDDNYKIICRNPSTLRPAFVIYNNIRHDIVDSFTDKRGQFLTMIVIKTENSIGSES